MAWLLTISVSSYTIGVMALGVERDCHGYSQSFAPSAAASAAGGPLDVPTVASGAAASEAPGFDTLGGSDNGIGTTTQGSTGKTTPSPTQRELIVAAPSPEASRVAVSQSSADANANGPSGLVVFSVVLLGAGVLVLLLRSISRRVSAR
jgi:hypothetical protein